MGIYSSGNKWKAAAQGYEAQANNLMDYQQDIDFGRMLLSNIRRERIASAELSSYNYSDDWTSSSAAGAQANVQSSLAGDMGYAYSTSERAQDISNFQRQSEHAMRKYQKQQKVRNTSVAITAAAVGAAAGGALGFAGLAGGLTTGEAAVAGSSIGMGLGQMGTHNVEQGAMNVGRGLFAFGGNFAEGFDPEITEAGGYTAGGFYGK